MRKIRDTIIGLWPILKPYIPKRAQVIAILLAFLIGMIWGYALDPVVFHDADPSTLGQGWQDEWVRLIADRYDQVTSNAVATEEFNQNIVALLSRVDNPQEIVSRLGITQLEPLAATAQPGATAPAPNLIASIRPFILGPIVIVVVAVLGSLLYGFYINPIVVEPLRKRMRPKGAVDAKAEQDRQAIIAGRKLASDMAKQAATAPDTNFGPPVARHVSIYFPGRAYDDSFSIEDEAKDDEFLGECGAVISETIGSGDPEKVTAVEVWLFDKEDFVRTLTGVFASEHAANDPALRSKLETKGQIIIAKPDASIILETNSLRLQVRILDMAYGAGTLPTNSYFEKMSIEFQAWRKAGAPASVSVTPSMATTPSYTPPPAPAFTPPPRASAPLPSPTFAPPPSPAPLPSAAPTYGGGLTPLKPPPLQAPSSPPPANRPQDDDPFGGTGDWTPVG